METMQTKNDAERNYEFRRINIQGVQIAEIYYNDNSCKYLDYVVMNFDLSNSKEVENRIKDYKKNGGTCIIGCIKSPENVDDAEWSAIKSLFDIYVDNPSDLDFENLIDYCISAQNSLPHVGKYDFRSKPGTEVFVVTEQNQNIAELIESIKSSSHKVLKNRPIEKFPKIVASIMTNGHELLINDLDKIVNSVMEYLTNDCQYMISCCQCMEGLNENEIKVTMLFFVNETIPVSSKS